MNTHDKYELPPLPNCSLYISGQPGLCMINIDHMYELLTDYARAAIEADRKRRDEPVAWLYEDELPDNYPYEAMFPYSKVDGVRMFPVYVPQPAVPAQVQHVDDINVADIPAVSAEHATLNLQPSSSMQPVATAFFTEKGEVAFTGLFDRTLKALEAVKTTRMGISSGSIDLYAAPQAAESVNVPEGYVLVAEDYLEVMIGPERMDHLRRSCRFPVPKRTPNTQPAEPVKQRHVYEGDGDGHCRAQDEPEPCPLFTDVERKNAKSVKRKRRYAQGTALGEFGIIPMCDQVDDEPDEERLAMEAVMESVDPATWPGLTPAQRCALGRFAKPQPAEPCVSSVSDKTTCGSASGDCDSQRAEPVTLECPKCGVDRAKAPCAGNLMDCEFKGVAHAAEPVKVPSDETLRLVGVIADKIEGGTLFQAGIFSRREMAEKVRTVLSAARYGQPAQTAEPWYGHKYKEYPDGTWRCADGCGPILVAQPAASAEQVVVYMYQDKQDYVVHGTVPKGTSLRPGINTLYTAPVSAQPSVPEPLKYGREWKDHYVTGWNNCRAAMLAAEQAQQDDPTPEEEAWQQMERRS